jgi:RNA-directed DNA polymerase
MDKVMLRKWLKAGYMEQGVRYATDAGTPQGGIISPTVANLALDGLERELRQRFPKPKNGYNAKVNLIRYADDFVVTGCSQEVLEHEVRPLIEAFLRERGLELSTEKTRITHIEEGFDFLGFHLRKYKAGKQRKLLITPAKKNVQAFLTKIGEVIKTNKALPSGRLIVRLNPLIVGWINYYQHVVSKVIFSSVDHAIFGMIWRWAKRRHPNKGRGWVKKKYFKTVGNDHWVFYGMVDGKEKQLVIAAAKPIVRHVKIEGKANPYDPAWEPYFEKRLGVKMAANLQGRRQLVRLWREQNGRCLVCNQRITEITGWHNHHIIWRSRGGPDTAENRVLLHPTCHAQVHSQGVYVAKPRPARGE